MIIKLIITLNMIHPFQRADVVAIQHDLPAKLAPVLLYVIMLNHNHNHIHLGEELVKIEDLIGNDSL